MRWCDLWALVGVVVIFEGRGVDGSVFGNPACLTDDRQITKQSAKPPIVMKLAVLTIHGKSQFQFSFFGWTVALYNGLGACCLKATIHIIDKATHNVSKCSKACASSNLPTILQRHPPPSTIS